MRFARPVRSQSHRPPDINALAVWQRTPPTANVMQSSRHHTNDCERYAQQPNSLSDNVRITAETALPQTMTQDDDCALIRNLFIPVEFASQYGSETKRSEKAR